MFSSELADIRFGYGPSPDLAGPASVAAMLDGLTGADTMAARLPIPGFDSFRPRIVARRETAKAMREVEGTDRYEDARQAYEAVRTDAMWDAVEWCALNHLRRRYSATPMRERMVAFWADHFTVAGRNAMTVSAVSGFVEDAIRPNVGGRMADLLFAAVTHPMMLLYLDQVKSTGPNSPRARKGGRNRGLNENLAREVLELHTLGVDGPYDQADVRELAKLLTGLTYRDSDGFRFDPAFAEPGAETLLGRSYGHQTRGLATVRAALEDLAVHPATARHLARKLAVHFVSDRPEPDLVDHVVAAYTASQGDLVRTYAALLEHPASWSPELRNVRPPEEFVSATCRVLGVEAEHLATLAPKRKRSLLIGGARLMGQTWQRPPGPDGWPEADEAWITPQGVAARLRWALQAPAALNPDLPEPQVFVERALGALAPEAVRFAARAAERRAEAIGLVLASPAFQRR